MKQIVFIHGGNVFPNEENLLEVLSTWEYDPKRERKRRREDWLSEQLKSEYDFFKPPMPNQLNASYKVWKLRFEKVQKILNQEDTLLIGHSLGAMFLIKYIGENGFPNKVKQLHLIAPVLDSSGMKDEDSYLGDFAYSPNIIPNLQKICEEIFLYHSTDDPVVPYEHSQRIMTYLPHAKLTTFTDKWHFSGEITFPELLENIRNK